jgi:hypothetical protein
MTILEPTPERVAVMRTAVNGRLYLDMDHKRFQLGHSYATDTETNALCEAQDAALVDMGDVDAWVRIGAGPLIRQMVATDAGHEWLAQAEQESSR